MKYADLEIARELEEIRNALILFREGAYLHEIQENITEKARQLPIVDRMKFVGLARQELSSLHEGNIARYQVIRADFRKWLAVLDKR